MWRTVPRRIALVLCVLLAVFGVILAPSPTLSSGSPLDPLNGLSAKDSAKYLEAHPDVALAAVNDDPESIAEWWTSTSTKEQKALISTIPETIGNMDGVDYRSRDIANRKHLAAALVTAEKAVAKNKENTTAQDNLVSLKAINSTISGHRSPKRYLVSLSDDSPPLAAVAVGNLDTADLVTFTVPGMGTFTSDMQLWTQSAQNVYDQQGTVGATEKRAVVSWINYVAPPPPPSIAVTQGTYAAAGAVRLVDDIEGFWAVRATSQTVPILNVVAHSYGTTTSADALFTKDLGVYSFVMLGSAGIERNIPNAAALHAQHVYAAEAAMDPEARLGRFDRVDPRSPSFGATVFDVDSTVGKFVHVTGHDPILHSDYNDDPLSKAFSSIKDPKQRLQQEEEHAAQSGYLDTLTESLENTAIATTPNANRSFVTPKG